MTTTNPAGSGLAIREDQHEFTPQQVAALRHIGAEGATEGDLMVFFHQAQRTGLDPFARQLYLVGRNEWDARTKTSTTKFTIQTGIDGFRLIARRASDAAREPFGYEDTLWADASGRWHDVWLSDQPPAAAKVTVIRNGQRFPAVALFREYAGTKRDGGLTRMWAEKGALMLAKCAEALALRKAFPQDLSGLYTADEMARAHEDTPPPVVASQRDWQDEADQLAAVVDVSSLYRLHAEAKAAGATAADLAHIIACGKAAKHASEQPEPEPVAAEAYDAETGEVLA